MASQLESAILKLKGFGFFEFILPFLFTSAVFYGLLRKSKVMGDPKENVAVNSIIALVAGFMVWAYPVLAGVSIENLFSEFFFKGSIIILTVLIAVLVAGMFLPPDLPKVIGDNFKGGRGTGMFIIGGALLAIVLAVSVGIDKILFPNWTFARGGVGFAGIDSDTMLAAILIIAMAAVVIAISWGGGNGSGKS
jgi:hypothetical protein